MYRDDTDDADGDLGTTLAGLKVDWGITKDMAGTTVPANSRKNCMVVAGVVLGGSGKERRDHTSVTMQSDQGGASRA